MQPIYNSLGLHYLIKDGDKLKERLFDIARGRPMLVIFDDMINSQNLDMIANLFLVDGRHRQLSMIFISQKLFVNDNNYREISQNVDYFIIFKNPRNVQEIGHLSSQMSTKNGELISYYKQATIAPFSYLMINLTQECEDKVKYLSHLFNNPNTVETYFDNNNVKLVDGGKCECTQFECMYIKKEGCDADGVNEFTHN